VAKERLNIALAGTRGIPANYGGFETFAEELSTRMVERGHRVTVYGRSNNIKYKERYYKGVQLVILPTIPHKYLDTVVHTLICTIHMLFKKHDLVLLCNGANSPHSIVPRLFGKKVVLNVDGLDRKRKKWNSLGKLYYLVSEYLSTFLPNEIVTDARSVENYYRYRFDKESVLIRYGVNVQPCHEPGFLERYGLENGRYFLYVSRLEPENNAHLVIDAFEKVQTDIKLAIVGDAPYSKKYIKKLKDTYDERIVFTGGVYGKGYKLLQSGAFAYVHATEVGGTHPALVEGMGFGNCVIFNDVAENMEVVGDAGIGFSADGPDDLRSKMQFLVDNPETAADYGEKARKRALSHFSWDKIVDQYLELFKNVLNNGASRGSGRC